MTKKAAPSSKSHFLRHSSAKVKATSAVVEKLDRLGVSVEEVNQATSSFRFNFGSDSASKVVKGGKEEEPAVAKFKFTPSDNSFRFGFANQDAS